MKKGVTVKLDQHCGWSVGAFNIILMNILFGADLNVLCLFFSSVII